MYWEKRWQLCPVEDDGPWILQTRDKLSRNSQRDIHSETTLELLPHLSCGTCSYPYFTYKRAALPTGPIQSSNRHPTPSYGNRVWSRLLAVPDQQVLASPPTCIFVCQTPYGLSVRSAKIRESVASRCMHATISTASSHHHQRAENDIGIAYRRLGTGARTRVNSNVHGLTVYTVIILPPSGR